MDWVNDILDDPEYVDGDIYTDAAVRLFMYKRSIFMEFINKLSNIIEEKKVKALFVDNVDEDHRYE